MRINFNFEKKHLWILAVLVILVVGAGYAFAAVPSPGHSGSELDLSDGVSVDNLPISCSGTRCLDVDKTGADGGFVYQSFRRDGSEKWWISSGTSDNLVIGPPTVYDFFRIDSNGNVGIGTAEPEKKLHVKGGWLKVGDSGDVANSIQLEPQNGFHRIASKVLKFWDWDLDRDVIVFDEGNIDVEGSVTAAEFVGDGSGLSGITISESDPTIPDCANKKILQRSGNSWSCVDMPESEITSESDTLQSVTDRGATTTREIDVGGLRSDGDVIIKGKTYPEDTVQIWKSLGIGLISEIGGQRGTRQEINAAIFGRTDNAGVYSGFFAGGAGVRVEGNLEVTGDISGIEGAPSGTWCGLCGDSTASVETCGGMNVCNGCPAGWTRKCYSDYLWGGISGVDCVCMKN